MTLPLHQRAAALTALLVSFASSAAPPGANALVAEALELATQRSGRVIAGRLEREAAEATLETSVAKYGRTAVAAARDGGLELLDAARVHGPDVMELASQVSPAARRLLALEPERLLPLARAVGPQALELEAKAPGMAQRIVDVFGVDGARTLAVRAPAEDLPRLVMYGEKASTPRARKLLLARYLEEGSALFTRVRPADVLAKGLSEAMILGGAALVASQVMPYLASILWALAALGAIGLVVEWLRRREPAVAPAAAPDPARPNLFGPGRS